MKQKSAAICIIENDKGEILILERTCAPLGWGLVGGKVDEGENPQEACKREIMEETTISISDDDLEYIGMVPSTSNGYMMYIFKTKLDHTPTVTISEEHHNYKWTSNIVEVELAGHTDNIIMMYTLSNMSNFTEE
jgi:8-oxo-dGTP diphosphatase